MYGGLKKSLVFAFFTIILLTAKAQTQFANNPEKYIFYEVTETDSLPAALLYHNALQWVRSLGDVTITKADSTAGKIDGKHEFFVYKEKGVTKKVSGKVSYAFMIEVKDSRYRYYFNGFIFHYYGFDRYYNTIEIGKKKRLDDAEASGWQKLWDQHRKTTTSKITTEISQLKTKIIEIPVVATPVSPEIKKEVKWD